MPAVGLIYGRPLVNDRDEIVGHTPTVTGETIGELVCPTNRCRIVAVISAPPDERNVFDLELITEVFERTNGSDQRVWTVRDRSRWDFGLVEDQPQPIHATIVVLVESRHEPLTGRPLRVTLRTGQSCPAAQVLLVW